jgi:hypothetical protein
MVEPSRVVEVMAIVIGVVKPESDAFSQRITDPVFPLRVRSAGVPPEQIVWAEATVPPTEVALTVTVAEPLIAAEQVGAV